MNTVDLWMKHCVRHGVSFDDCARGAQVLMERDDDGELSNEAYYLAKGFAGLQAALEQEKMNPAMSDLQTIDWQRQRF
jgi:hypothetical protein